MDGALRELIRSRTKLVKQELPEKKLKPFPRERRPDERETGSES